MRWFPNKVGSQVTDAQRTCRAYSMIRLHGSPYQLSPEWDCWEFTAEEAEPFLELLKSLGL
jgi:hypothetical protein